MDTPVALVQAYLYLNGYFTVTEYPVVEAMRRSGYRSATDLDVLALRFPQASRVVARHKRSSGEKPEPFEPDSALNSPWDCVDMIIGEVKEGLAQLNRATRDPGVLHAVLARFGCCEPQHISNVVEELIHKGHARTHNGHQIRLVAFGAYADDSPSKPYVIVTLDHIAHFVQTYLREHWDVLHHAQFKDPALSFFMMLEKAQKGAAL